MNQLTRHEPRRNLEHRLLDEGFFRPFFGLRPFLDIAPMLMGWDEEGTLPVDISEAGDEMIIRATLPGFRKEEIEVEIENGVLSIKAARKNGEEAEKESYFRRERWTSPVSRRVALPSMVTAEKLEARLENGILTLRLPIPAETRPRKVRIE